MQREYVKRVVPKTKSSDVVHHDNQWQQTYMQQKEETSAGYQPTCYHLPTMC